MLEDIRVVGDVTKVEKIIKTLPVPNAQAFILDKIIDLYTNQLNNKDPKLDEQHPDDKD